MSEAAPDLADPSDGDRPDPGSGEGCDPSDPSARIAEQDRTLFRVPVADHPITANEIHAIVIGATLGASLGWTFLLGYAPYSLVGAAFLVGYAVLGEPFLKSLPHEHVEYEHTVALRTIRYEPWWFLAPFVSAFGVVINYV